jgi:hypothetical protein
LCRVSLILTEDGQAYKLALTKIVYTQFKKALDKITLSEAGEVGKFIAHLQLKLDAKLEGATDAQLADAAPDIPADEPDLIDELENL